MSGVYLRPKQRGNGITSWVLLSAKKNWDAVVVGNTLRTNTIGRTEVRLLLHAASFRFEVNLRDLVSRRHEAKTLPDKGAIA